MDAQHGAHLLRRHCRVDFVGSAEWPNNRPREAEDAKDVEDRGPAVGGDDWASDCTMPLSLSFMFWSDCTCLCHSVSCSGQTALASVTEFHVLVRNASVTEFHVLVRHSNATSIAASKNRVQIRSSPRHSFAKGFVFIDPSTSWPGVRSAPCFMCGRLGERTEETDH